MSVFFYYSAEIQSSGVGSAGKWGELCHSIPVKTKEDVRSRIDILRSPCLEYKDEQAGSGWLGLPRPHPVWPPFSPQTTAICLWRKPTLRCLFLFLHHPSRCFYFRTMSSLTTGVCVREKRARKETTRGELRGQSPQEYSRLRFNIKQFAGLLPSICPSNSIQPLIDCHGNRAYSQDKAAEAEKRIT